MVTSQILFLIILFDIGLITPVICKKLIVQVRNIWVQIICYNIEESMFQKIVIPKGTFVKYIIKL
jgi:hypothetical protein